MMNFTRDFFRKAVREKKLEQFDIFVDDISHLEIIRVLENVKNNETDNTGNMECPYPTMKQVWSTATTNLLLDLYRHNVSCVGKSIKVKNKKGRNRASCEFQEQLSEINKKNQAIFPTFTFDVQGDGGDQWRRAMADDDWDVVNMVVNNTTRYQRLTADEKRKTDAICQAYTHDEMSDTDDPFDDDADETDLT
ncbi:hypothetical protein QE152_g38516 [Popillia japonica]|uniref:Uncharacterized protein n=1 Tax=Popillia japonica TaxID=7064 RepID=A0AAW1HW83_POPJA